MLTAPPLFEAHGSADKARTNPAAATTGLSENYVGRVHLILEPRHNDAHKPGDLEFNIFGVHAVAGSDGAAVIDAIAPQEGDEIVNKRYYSTFTETDLDSICKIHGIGRLVMVGQHTDCCVRHTSYDAYVRGHEVVVVSDATAVFEPLSKQPHQERQQAALDYLKMIYGAKILSTDELLAELSSEAA